MINPENEHNRSAPRPGHPRPKPVSHAGAAVFLAVTRIALVFVARAAAMKAS